VGHIGCANVDLTDKRIDGIGMNRNKNGKDESLDTVRGYEGDAVHAYFGVFDQLIIAQKNQFSFDERNRRPSLDNVN
jgi:CRISPR/Cas system-associated endonuclease Cas1